ncbi:hypothetical protein AB836_00160 [Rickettsiales bacterium (ex Bugula neritina AB1)]|nr:hypothetical protein AB836_00160 [Rickettsiales bacterium (ex Bugula neritina AB1)]
MCKIVFILTTPPIENIIHNIFDINEIDKNILQLLINNNIKNVKYINNQIHLSFTEYIYKEYQVYFSYNSIDTNINFNDKFFYYHDSSFFEKFITHHNFEENLINELYKICKYLYIQHFSLKLEIILNYYDNHFVPGNCFFFDEKKYEILQVHFLFEYNKVFTKLLVFSIDNIPLFTSKIEKENDNNTFSSPFFFHNNNLFILNSCASLSSKIIIFS